MQWTVTEVNTYHSIIIGSLLEEAKMPNDCKQANIKSFCKESKKEEPLDYRPLPPMIIVAKMC